MNARMSGASVLVQSLIDLGVDTVFGYPGGAILPVFDALFDEPRIRNILVRHEAGAIHAAQGYARSTGRPGVVIVTSGPGVTNVVTGLADALMDSNPVVVICGQVPTHLIGSDAFQECDTVGITRHCTKHNYLVKDPARLAQVVHEAFHIASTGRPGPVVIDLPKDVQIADVAGYQKPELALVQRRYPPTRPVDLRDIESAVDMLAAAERPVFYTGGGVINAGPEASQALRGLAELCGAPVTSTLMGLGAFPASSQQWLGMLGLHGTYEANMAMHEADLVVAVGARFDDRVTGRLDGFSPYSRKIHIDIDRSSIGKNVPVDLAIVGDALEALAAMDTAWRRRNLPPSEIGDWYARIDGWRARRCLAFTPSRREILPQQAVTALWCAVKDRSPIITTEVGQHQMWSAQHMGFEAPNKWLTSGGLGTMGYGLPAAVGAQLGNPDTLVIDVSGEASFQMNMQELSTAVQYDLPIKLFILNNERLGMVGQLQDVSYGGRHAQSYSEALPDFVLLAEAYGWSGIRISTPDKLETGIMRMLDTPGPVLVDCRVSKFANCFPMIATGGTHAEMLFGPEDVSAELPDEAKALV
jgi:acetolactate synthase-1/2/3 large subunit